LRRKVQPDVLDVPRSIDRGLRVVHSVFRCWWMLQAEVHTPLPTLLSGSRPGRRQRKLIAHRRVLCSAKLGLTKCPPRLVVITPCIKAAGKIIKVPGIVSQTKLPEATNEGKGLLPVLCRVQTNIGKMAVNQKSTKDGHEDIAVALLVMRSEGRVLLMLFKKLANRLPSPFHNLLFVNREREGDSQDHGDQNASPKIKAVLAIP
jgi:hypothetical protein